MTKWKTYLCYRGKIVEPTYIPIYTTYYKEEDEWPLILD